MTAKILVGVDGSDLSANALVWASRLAASRGDTVVQPVLGWHYPATTPSVLGDALALPPLDDLQAAAAAQLRECVEKARPRCDSRAHMEDGVIVQGAAGVVLCEMAEAADLLVLGSRGMGGFTGLVLGSVSAHCANASPIPVAIIPETWQSDETEALAVIGVDGSANSDAAVRWADEWMPASTRLRLVHAWTYPVGYNAEAVAYDPALLEDVTTQLLEQAAKQAPNHEVEVVNVRGDARHELHVQSEGADLLIIGARGHTGIVRLLLGSVASSMVHHLTVPTVIVRTHDE